MQVGAVISMSTWLNVARCAAFWGTGWPEGPQNGKSVDRFQ